MDSRTAHESGGCSRDAAKVGSRNTLNLSLARSARGTWMRRACSLLLLMLVALGGVAGCGAAITGPAFLSMLSGDEWASYRTADVLAPVAALFQRSPTGSSDEDDVPDAIGSAGSPPPTAHGDPWICTTPSPEDCHQYLGAATIVNLGKEGLQSVLFVDVDRSEPDPRAQMIANVYKMDGTTRRWHHVNLKAAKIEKVPLDGTLPPGVAWAEVDAPKEETLEHFGENVFLVRGAAVIPGPRIQVLLAIFSAKKSQLPPIRAKTLSAALAANDRAFAAIFERYRAEKHVATPSIELWSTGVMLQYMAYHRATQAERR